MSPLSNGTTHAIDRVANARESGSHGFAKRSDQSSLAPQLCDTAAATARKRERQRETGKWEMTRALAPYFDRAVALWLARGGEQRKATEYGDEIGVDPSTLSLLRKGERLISPEHFMPLLSVPECAAELARGMVAPSGGDVRIVRKQAVTWERARTWIVEWVLRDDRTRNHALRDIAEEKGVERGDLDVAIEGENEDDDAADEREPLHSQGAAP
jgi:hypothetical protein